MSNPSNLVRLPNLSVPNPSAVGHIDNRNIVEMIVRIWAQQCQIAIKYFLNPNSDIGGEGQTIEDSYRHNLTDLDKEPDIVKCFLAAGPYLALGRIVEIECLDCKTQQKEIPNISRLWLRLGTRLQAMRMSHSNLITQR